jgi:DNA-binding NtrC family response regulator
VAAPVATAGDMDLLGASLAMVQVRRSVSQAADAPFPVLIHGGISSESHSDLALSV